MMKNQDTADNKMTRHHIIPQSRGGKNTPQNICKVKHKFHDLYHRLFGNMTPEEIIEYLNYHFWNNNYQITIHNK